MDKYMAALGTGQKSTNWTVKNHKQVDLNKLLIFTFLVLMFIQSLHFDFIQSG